MRLRTSKEAGTAGAGKTRAILVGDGAAWPIERTSLFSLSKEEAAEGPSQGLTCFDIHWRRIVWATAWGRPLEVEAGLQPGCGSHAGAAVLSEECGTIERTPRREAELSGRRLELRLGPGGPTKQEACGTPGPTQCPPACCPDPPGGPDALGHFCCTQDHVGVCHGDIKGRRGRKERNQPADCAPAGRKGRQPGSSSPAAH